MKCICFGSLFVLMYQARGQGIKSAPLCSAIFAPFGVNLAYRDTSLPGHLKNGHDRFLPILPMLSVNVIPRQQSAVLKGL